MSKDNREELKPCPFCGDKVRYRKSDGEGVCKTTHYINCDNCGLEMFDITEKGLIENWNWRNGEVTIDSGADAKIVSIETVYAKDGCNGCVFQETLDCVELVAKLKDSGLRGCDEVDSPMIYKLKPINIKGE